MPAELPKLGRVRLLGVAEDAADFEGSATGRQIRREEHQTRLQRVLGPRSTAPFQAHHGPEDGGPAFPAPRGGRAGGADDDDDDMDDEADEE